MFKMRFCLATSLLCLSSVGLEGRLQIDVANEAEYNSAITRFNLGEDLDTIILFTQDIQFTADTTRARGSVEGQRLMIDGQGFSARATIDNTSFLRMSEFAQNVEINRMAFPDGRMSVIDTAPLARTTFGSGVDYSGLETLELANGDILNVQSSGSFLGNFIQDDRIQETLNLSEGIDFSFSPTFGRQVVIRNLAVDLLKDSTFRIEPSLGSLIDIGALYVNGLGTSSKFFLSNKVNSNIANGEIELSRVEVSFPEENSVFTPQNTFKASEAIFNLRSGQTVFFQGPILGDEVIANANTTRFDLTVTGPGVLALQSNENAFVGLSIRDGATVQVWSAANLGNQSADAVMQIQNGRLDVSGNCDTIIDEWYLGDNVEFTVAEDVSLNFLGDLTLEVAYQDLQIHIAKSGSGNLSMLPSNVLIIGEGLFPIDILDGTMTTNATVLKRANITLSPGTELTLIQDQPGQLDGVITGAGDINTSGLDPLEIIEDVTKEFSGNFTVREGSTLRVPKRYSSAGSIILENGATLTSKQGAFSYITSVIQLNPGESTLSVPNNSVLTLSTSPIGEVFNKAWGGTLVIMNSIRRVATISSGDKVSSLPELPSFFIAEGTLAASGDVGALRVFPGAILEAGAMNTDTLTAFGNILFLEESGLQVSVTPTLSSSIVSTEFVIIDAAVNVSVEALPGLYGDEATFTIVDSQQPINGRFAGVNVLNSYDFLSASLSYPTANTVDLTIKSLNLATLVKGANAVATAKALQKVVERNRATGGDALSELLTSLIPFVYSSKQMTYAMNQLNPALFKALQVVQQSNSTQVRESLSVRLQNELDCKRKKRTLNAWIHGMGDVLNQDSLSYAKSPQIGYRSTMGGFTAGVDAHFADYFYLGALGGFTSAHINWKENEGRGDVNTGYGGLYFSAIGEMFYGNISTIGGWSGYKTTRNIHYPGVTKTAKNHHGGRELLTHADTGINFKWSRFTLRPFDSLDYQTQTENGFGEHGSGQWNLSVKKSNSIMLRNELGLQFASCFCFNDTKWSVTPKLSWVREMRIKGSAYKTAFRGSEFSSFAVTGYFPNRNLISPGLILSGALLDERLTINLSYDGEFRGDYSANRYGGEIRYAY